jgi:adenylylsulfate kinase-like enzyme
MVFVDSPVEICEARDVKGLYAKARRGEIKDFTGVNDPYEAPTDAEIVVTTADRTPDANADAIVAYLSEQGYLQPVGEALSN